MNEQLETLTPDGAIQAITEAIGDTLQDTFDILIERRDTAFASAVTPLETERENLAKEYSAISEAAANLEALLPAQARESQRQADALLLAGKREEAETKITEQREAEAGPEKMRERQRGISKRLEAIGEEKKDIARRIFESWYGELQQVIRASEHGLFIGLLDKSRDEMYNFQADHDLGATLDKPYSALVNDSRLSGLTASERSPEWTSGNRWYRGRR